MKTKIISKLKKELLIIELPEETYFEIFKHGILFKNHLEAEREFIEGSYTLLGSHDEIKEDDVRVLVKVLWNCFRNYSEDGSVGNYQRLVYKTALESFNSALESEIYWNVNPMLNPDDIEDYHPTNNELIIAQNKFNSAQEKTFDKSRTLIFVKNEKA